MRSGLLSSLFKDNSANNRSSSLFQRQQNLASESLRARSQSTNRDRISDYSGQNKNVPLIRMNLLINTKLRMFKQTAFCKLQNYKKNLLQQRTASAMKNKLLQKSILKLESNNSREYICGEFMVEDIQQQKINNQATQQIQPLKTKTRKNQISRQSIENFSDICAMLEAKYYRNNNIQCGFRELRKYCKKKIACEKVLKALQRFTQQKTKQIGIENIKNRQKIVLKYDILVSVTSQLIRPLYSTFFTKFKQLKIESSATKSEKEKDKDEVIEFKYKRILQSITEQQFSHSQEQVVRSAEFYTPQKHQLTLFNSSKNKSKTKRKQTKKLIQINESKEQLPLKQYSSDQFEHEQTYPAFTRKQCSGSAKKITLKPTTKIHCNKTKICFPKALKIQTSLQENNLIEYEVNSLIQSSKAPCKILMVSEIPSQTEDIYDHIGIFKQFEFSLTREDSFPSSFRSCQQRDFSRDEISCQKTLQPMRITEQDEEQMHTEMSYRPKRQEYNPSYNNPSYIKELISGRKLQLPSHLHNIQDMMLELQKLQHKQKFLKYSSSNGHYGYPKCKISVNLPNRRITFSGNSCNTSANKKSAQIKSTNNESFSEKKYKRRNLLARYQSKPNQVQKQNIEVRLWEDKKSTLFLSDENQNSNVDIKKKGSLSNVETSRYTTARKMKKQIQQIIHKRKNRGSISNIRAKC